MPGNLCKYSHMFGDPGTGSHAQRIFGLALIDVVLTLGAAYLISSLTHGPTDISAFLITALILGILGIIMHELFCVNTKLNSMIFQRPFVQG
jgi:fatty acid desaturase